jgi:hypothetical protein
LFRHDYPIEKACSWRQVCSCLIVTTSQPPWQLRSSDSISISTSIKRFLRNP